MIETKRFGVCYGSKVAIKDVSLSMRPNEITAIVGPSGCGKSSFLCGINRLTDLVPDATTQGQVLVDGKNVLDVDVSPVHLRRRVGMIFQAPNPFPMSIRRNMQIALREQGIRDRHQLDGITENCLKDVGLWDEVSGRLDTLATRLSGGQQQRLCLARAIALQPDALLFDEPCSALDPNAASRVEEMILRLGEQYTIVIVTHNLAQARRISQNLAVFWSHGAAGEMIEWGRTNDVFEDARDPVARSYVAGTLG